MSYNQPINYIDLLYWVQQNDGRPDHATIISDVKENKLYFAGNTSARFDKEVTADYFLEYQYLYIVRLKDEVFDDEIKE